MDFIGSSKAASYGNIWNSHAVQRARNSHVPAHVGHQRNTYSTGPHLLRLDSVGEVSSEKDQTQVSTNMAPKVSFVDTSTSVKSRFMETFTNWFPVGNSAFNFRKTIGGLTNYKTATTQRCNPGLCEIFCEQKEKLDKPFNKVQAPINRGMQIQMFSTAYPVQPCGMLQKNSFNQDLLNSNTMKDLSSPWNKFYADWKKGNSEREESMEHFSNKLSKQPAELPLSRSCVPDLISTLQCLSIKDHGTAGKSDSFDKTKGMESRSTEGVVLPELLRQEVVGDQNTETSGNGRFGKTQHVETNNKEQDNTAKISIKCLPEETCNCREKSNLTVEADTHLHDRQLKRLRCDRCVNSDEASRSGLCLKQGKMEIPSSTFAGHLGNESSSKRKPKRTRPSSKKRRRLKARQLDYGTSSASVQQNSASDQSQHSQSKTSATSEAAFKTLSHPVSFILGINELEADDGQNKSFKVSVLLDDDESAFSDNDDDCDITSFQCDFLPHNGDFFNPLNFTLSISVSPSTPDSCPVSPFHRDSAQLDAINATWKLSDGCESVKSETCKKVRFAPDDSLQHVHPIIAWSYAYQAARKGPWEEYARDRQRFQRRIAESEEILAPIFKPCHRAKAYDRQISSKYA